MISEISKDRCKKQQQKNKCGYLDAILCSDFSTRQNSRDQHDWGDRQNSPQDTTIPHCFGIFACHIAWTEICYCTGPNILTTTTQTMLKITHLETLYFQLFFYTPSFLQQLLLVIFGMRGTN